MKPNLIPVIIGTSLFTGFIAFGPGTFASILALPLVYLLHHNWLAYLIVTVTVLVIGTLSAEYLGRVWQKKDDQRITIDEFIGILVTFLLIPKINWYILLVGFVLFRIFDIIKPLWIRKTEQVKGGLGVMLDDIVSGIYANIFLRILLWII
ncbi:MAG: phosphatidylglycerophosphatase A [Candidatus Latescibacteria bacterium]|nr:phosphatidylglycerophosphatase A [Candidatus Latescibacterota bacterium]